jgi:hypothetical protein
MLANCPIDGCDIQIKSRGEQTTEGTIYTFGRLAQHLVEHYRRAHGEGYDEGQEDAESDDGHPGGAAAYQEGFDAGVLQQKDLHTSDRADAYQQGFDAGIRRQQAKQEETK